MEKETEKYDLSEVYSKMRDFNFNFIDCMILISTSFRSLSVGELQREINIAHKNLYPHIHKLEKYNLVKINDKGKGRKKLITANYNNPKAKSLILALLYFFGINDLFNIDNGKL